ncbi:retinitis pigmentosa 1-like 1 protein [Entelurus aequoreus]|uniref:retinitis pigmentosa 1-like 1 protein n=1 Tax=Entelurus aequoreus TaxID=161455 RepID=UPI002B1D4E53|nr:retinitis pigmentosa 1-like 1 protein [Entelurus aequoreus]
MEALQSLSSLCHYDHHHNHRQPHQHVRWRPGRPDNNPLAPQRHVKRIILVKNSNPSVRKTIVLQRKGLRSFGLFLEELSALMQYHVRKVCTLDGHKVENVQNVMHCPGVLICVGRDPSHPSILERFRKAAEDTLPMLSTKARSACGVDSDDGHAVQPKLESTNGSTRHSVSSDKSLPDGTESLEDVTSCPATANRINDDDVEKLVRINEDGSLSMKMKVRFRLENDETLLWSTEVRKSSNRTCEHQVLDRSCLGSENVSETGEAHVRRRHQRQGFGCPHCCSQTREYNIWTNTATGSQRESGSTHTSSSGASSHRVVSRKSMVESRKTVAKSSEEHLEEVVEHVKSFETVEYCAIHSESCMNTVDNCEAEQERELGSTSSSRQHSLSEKPEKEELTGDAMPETLRKSSSGSTHSKKSTKKSRRSYACHCGASDGSQDTQMQTNSEETLAVTSVRSNSLESNECKETHDAEPAGVEEDRSKSAMSVHSNASTKCKPKVLECNERPSSQTSAKSEVTSELCQSEKEAEAERPTTSCSSRSTTSVTSKGYTHVDEAEEEYAKEQVQDQAEESESGQRTQSQMSMKSSKKSKSPEQSLEETSEVNTEGLESTKDVQDQVRLSSVLSATSTKSKTLEVVKEIQEASAMLNVDDCPEEETEERPPTTISVESVISDVRSRKSKSPEVDADGYTTEATEGRPQSTTSIDSVGSVKSSISATSCQSKSSEAPDDECRSNGVPTPEETACNTSAIVSSLEVKDSVSNHKVEETERPASGYHSAMSEKTADSELSAESMKSRTSENRTEGNVDDAERAQSAMSTKSKASKGYSQSKASQPVLEQNDEDDSEQDASQRSPSAMSTKSTKSSICSRSNEDEREPSVMSVISQSDDVTSQSNVSEALLEDGVDILDEETKSRVTNAMLARSNKSARSIKSKYSADVPADETSECSIQSQASAERPLSALSAKSTKSQVSGKSTKSDVSGMCAEDVGEEDVERSHSEMSAKSAMSSFSTKSKVSNISANGHYHQERVSSSRSVRSERSAETNVSAKSKSIKDSPSDHDMDSPGEKLCDSRSISSLSVLSSVSARSSKSKCSTKVLAEQCRPKSHASDVSSKSNVSEVLTREISSRAESKVSAKSTKSNKSKVSADKNTFCHEPVERALSNLSIKSAISARTCVSGVSRDVPELTSEHSVEISEMESEAQGSSRQSVESGTSARVIGSKTEESTECAVDNGDEEQLEAKESFQSQDFGVTGGVSMQRSASSFSASSTKTKSSGLSLFNKNNENHDEISQIRSASKLSVKSTKTNTSVSSRATSEVPSEENTTNGEETEQRPVSAKSARSAKSAQSNTSATSSNILHENNDENTEKAPSSFSVKSTKSRRSNSSATSKKSEAAADDAIIDATKIKSDESAKSVVSEKIELRKGCEKCKTPSVMTIKSDISLKSRTSNISLRAAEMPDQDVNGISGTPSVLSVKSNVSSRTRMSEVAPSEQTDRRTHSVMSSVSVKSKNSEVPAVAVEDSEDRTPTGMSSKSKRSATSLGRKSRGNGQKSLSVKSVRSKKTEVDDNQQTSKDASSERLPNGPADKSVKENIDTDDVAIVPSNLPNASLTEVVSEWLKTIPADGELCDLEEFDENCDTLKSGTVVDEPNDDKAVENVNKPNDLNGVSGDEHHKDTDISNADCGDNDPKIFYSSVQVMKVLLNPKLDRCNSLPEVSPAYGRKLSTSARGFLDCLVKLQLIDHDPKNTDEKCERYKALMEILQSLWLCDSLDNEPLLAKDRHSDEEFNHTSSSGVDVNSGSTGSGKSSDGVNGNQAQTIADAFGKAQEVNRYEETGRGEEELPQGNQKGDRLTDETIRSNDSSREMSESPLSSGNGQRCDTGSMSESPVQSSKHICQDPDPVWVLSLLNKIEKQFMTHYINAMSEFKDQWKINDNEQLDRMIGEIKNVIETRIQTSIHRELGKIKGRTGLPRPPKETKSRPSTTQTDERRRKLKMKAKQSFEPQSGKSDDSAMSTVYSDQREETEDESCPCESCDKKKMAQTTPLLGEMMSTAPVLMDFDLKRILQMKNDDTTDHSLPNNETKAAATLIGQILENAIMEMEEDQKDVVDKANEGEITGGKVSEAKDEEEATLSEDQIEAPVEDNFTTNADMPLEEVGEACKVKTVILAKDTSAISGPEKDDAATVKDSNANTDNKVSTKEEVLAEEDRTERDEEGPGDGEEETLATSGNENKDADTMKDSNECVEIDDEVSAEDMTTGEAAVNIISEDEDEEVKADGDKEIPATCEDVEDEAATENEDANAAAEVTATSEHECEEDAEWGGVGKEQMASANGEENYDDVPNAAENEMIEGAIIEEDEQVAQEPISGVEDCPATSGDENNDAVTDDKVVANDEMMREEVEETAEAEDKVDGQVVAMTDEEMRVCGQEENPAASGNENDEAATAYDNINAVCEVVVEDQMICHEVTVTENAALGDAIIAASEQEPEENEEEKSSATSGGENEDSVTENEITNADDDVAAEDEKMSEDGAVSDDKDEEARISGEEEPSMGMENNDVDSENYNTNDEVAAEDEIINEEVVKVAEVNEAAQDDDGPEKDEEEKVSAEEDTPATSGDENAATDSDNNDAENENMNEEVAETVEEAAEETTMIASNEDESEKEEVPRDEETHVTGGDDNEDAANDNDDVAANDEKLREVVRETAAEEEESTTIIVTNEETSVTNEDENEDAATDDEVAAEDEKMRKEVTETLEEEAEETTVMATDEETPVTSGDENEDVSTDDEVAAKDEKTSEEDAETAEDEDAAREVTIVEDDKEDRASGEEETPFISGDENEDAANDDDVAAEDENMSKEIVETAEEEAEETIMMATNEDESEKEDVPSDEETPVTSGDENKDTTNDDDVSAEDEKTSEEVPETAEEEAENTTMMATTEGGPEKEEEEERETPITSGDENEDDVAEEDESLRKEVTETAEEEAEDTTMIATNEGGSEKEEDEGRETPITSGDENEDDIAEEDKNTSEEVSETAEDKDGAQEVTMTEDDEEDRASDEEETPVTMGDDNEDAANDDDDDENRSKEIVETAEEKAGETLMTATNADESEKEEEEENKTPVTSGVENEDATTDDEVVAEDEKTSDEIAETAEDEATTVPSENEFNKEEEVPGNEKTPVTSGDENEDATTDDEVVAEDEKTSEEIAETAEDEATTVPSEDESNKEEEVPGNEKTPVTSGDDNEAAATEDEVAAEDENMNKEIVETAEEEAEETFMMATNEDESEKEEEKEKKTPVTSGDENDDEVAAEDEKTAEEIVETAEDEATTVPSEDESNKEEEVPGNEKTPVNSGDENEEAVDEMEEDNKDENAEEGQTLPEEDEEFDESGNEEKSGNEGTTAEQTDEDEEEPAGMCGTDFDSHAPAAGDEHMAENEAECTNEGAADETELKDEEDAATIMKDSQEEDPEEEPAENKESVATSDEKEDVETKVAEDPGGIPQDDEEDEVTNDDGQDNVENYEDDNVTNRDTFEVSEKDELSANQGESADGEDEAESDDADEEVKGSKDFIPNKADNQEPDQARETTTLVVNNSLLKVSAESEDGVYADGEDSDTETLKSDNK